MNILYVSPSPPVPATYGDRLRNNLFLNKFLQKKDLNITLLTFFDKEYTNRYLSLIGDLTNIQYHYVERDSFIKRLLNIARFFFFYPIRVSNYYSKILIDKLQSLINKNEYDIIFISSIHLSVNFLFLDYKNIPTIIDSIDSKSLYVKRLINSTKNPLSNLLNKWEYIQLLKYEKLVANKFHQLILISDIDKTHIHTHTQAKNISIIKNSWSFPDFNNEPSIHKRETAVKKIIFTGNFSYPPNLDALIHFLSEILPGVKKGVPLLKFIICGPGKIDPKLIADESIEYYGEVPVLSEYLLKADVYVSPLLFGTGIKNKIVEAMHYGLPVVCYPVSNEGIDARNMEEIIIAINKDDYVHQLVNILIDENKRNTIGRNAKVFIDNYLKEDSSELLIELFRKTANANSISH
jgi:polysaccharide biosynthesis protein PslH